MSLSQACGGQPPSSPTTSPCKSAEQVEGRSHGTGSATLKCDACNGPIILNGPDLWCDKCKVWVASFDFAGVDIDKYTACDFHDSTQLHDDSDGDLLPPKAKLQKLNPAQSADFVLGPAGCDPADGPPRPTDADRDPPVDTEACRQKLSRQQRFRIVGDKIVTSPTPSATRVYL